MILLDTSIVIQLCRRPLGSTPIALPQDDVCICGVTTAEMLQGIRSDREAFFVSEMLSRFHHIPIEEDVWSETGLLLRELRRSGITIPFPDAIIMAVARQQNLAVWTTDTHFSLAQQVLTDLRLYQSKGLTP